MDVPPDIGKRLAAARGYAGLSQAELADRLEVGMSTIGRWENGRLPRSRLKAGLQEWADACGVPGSWLLAPSPFAGASSVSPDQPEWVGRLDGKLDEVLGILRGERDQLDRVLNDPTLVDAARQAAQAEGSKKRAPRGSRRSA